MKKVWLITGSSSGLGFQFCKQILESGDYVVAGTRFVGPLGGLYEQYPDHLYPIKLDVTNSFERKQFIEVALSKFDRIDYLVNNAGYGLVGAFEETDQSEGKANFETNFFAPLEILRECLVHFRKQKSGAVINISAIASFSNELGFSYYGASKAALETASDSIRGELKDYNLKVMSVVLGPFRTGFISKSLKSVSGRISDYANSAGKFANFLNQIDGKQAGDPGKAVRVILSEIKKENYLHKLVLGKYAHEKFNQKVVELDQMLTKAKEPGYETEY